MRLPVRGVTAIQLPQIDPGPCALLSGRHGLSQSNRYQRQRDNDCYDAERSEARWIGPRQKELPNDSGEQPGHAVDTQDLASSLFRCSAVEPALNDHEQSGKAKPGQRARGNPGNRMNRKQVRKRRGRRNRSERQEGPNVSNFLNPSSAAQ